MTGLTHTLRGAMIGLVELVPGVSGGTVALMLGIFDRLVISANHAVRGIAHAAATRDRQGAVRRLEKVEWDLILPLAMGMFLALFTLSGPLRHFVENQPAISSALFLGMVSASLLVPIGMARKARPASPAHRFTGPAVVIMVATATFLLLGLPTAQVSDPHWWVIVLSGAAAVCALVLPGLSGSFMLLTFGMYQPTLSAVSERDFAYLGLFIAGAVLGLASFVQLLAYLLHAHRWATLLVVTGLILGSLRALWPWQHGSTLLPPDSDSYGWPLLAGMAGAALVLALWWRERRVAR